MTHPRKGRMVTMCEHCTSTGEYHVHTDRPHWLCGDCLDALAAHHDWQAAA